MAGVSQHGSAENASEAWTTRRLIRWIDGHLGGKGIDSPRVCAEMLVGSVIGAERMRLYMEADRPASQEELDRLRALVVRAARHEPVQYLVGEAWFWSKRFAVGPATLIPRPETELLVELSCRHLQDNPAENQHILDLCTGSGCVGIATLASNPSVNGVLTDLSPDAIAIAWQNAELHGVFERSQLIVGDLDSDVASDLRFDVITANPPYIDPDDIETLAIEVRDWEPELALYATDAGYALYPRIAALALTRLRPRGLLAVECGHTQAGTIADMFAAAGLTNIKIYPDLAGIPRVVTANQL